MDRLTADFPLIPDFARRCSPPMVLPAPPSAPGSARTGPRQSPVKRPHHSNTTGLASTTAELNNDLGCVQAYCLSSGRTNFAKCCGGKLRLTTRLMKARTRVKRQLPCHTRIEI